MGTTQFQPSWWNEEKHGSAWQRVKEAMHRDWEQTKNDFGGKAPDLNQDVGDTVKQAVGADPVPPPSAKTPPSSAELKRAAKREAKAEMRGPVERWNDVESRLAYGYAARSYYATMYPHWDDGLESELRNEWDKSKPEKAWDEVKHDVRRGFDASRA